MENKIKKHRLAVVDGKEIAACNTKKAKNFTKKMKEVTCQKCLNGFAYCNLLPYDKTE